MNFFDVVVVVFAYFIFYRDNVHCWFRFRFGEIHVNSIPYAVLCIYILLLLITIHHSKWLEVFVLKYKARLETKQTKWIYVVCATTYMIWYDMSIQHSFHSSHGLMPSICFCKTIHIKLCSTELLHTHTYTEKGF